MTTHHFTRVADLTVEDLITGVWYWRDDEWGYTDLNLLESFGPFGGVKLRTRGRFPDVLTWDEVVAIGARTRYDTGKGRVTPNCPDGEPPVLELVHVIGETLDHGAE